MTSLYVEIAIEETFNSGWILWFEGLEIDRVGEGYTRISGQIPDHPALHGLLERIRDLNLHLVNVSVTPAAEREKK